MNTFNRVVLVVLCLVLMFGAASAIVLAWAGPDESIDWLRDAANWLDDHNTDGTKFIITVVGVTISVIALTVLIIELYPRSGGQVEVTDLQAGDAVLSSAAIGLRVEEALSELPNVIDARATVKAKRKGVTVNLDLHVAPEADLASVIDQASASTRSVLADKVHVALVEPPSTRIHYRELRLRGRLPRRPVVGGMRPSDGPDESEREKETDANT